MKNYIGIDPGKNTGIAVWNGKEFTDIKTLNFWDAYYYISAYDKTKTEVHIEVPRTKQNWHKSKSQITSANVGGVYREANLLFEGIEKLGFKVNKYHPKGKVTAAQFQRITGYKGRTNEHNRDAGMLVYGR